MDRCGSADAAAVSRIRWGSQKDQPERARGSPGTSAGRALRRQRRYFLAKELAGKKITPHVLRHSAAMALLHAGVDITVIALWLGHESVTTTQIYLNADMALKQQALDRTTPLASVPGRYKPPDRLLAFLEAL